jgi:hypothetical protein
LVNYNLSWNDPSNAVAVNTKVPAFVCPSDINKLPISLGATNNYYGNMGTNLLYQAPPTLASDPNYGMPPHNGAFSASIAVRFADFLDGTSNTAMFSEKNRGDGSNGISSPESDTYRPGTFPATPDQAMADCLAVNVNDLSKQGYSNVGAPWMQPYHSVSVYYHILPPNSRSCMFPPGRIASTAGSRHPGGVEVAMSDGSVRFISRTINLQTWRAIGTRDGNDVPGDF